MTSVEVILPIHRGLVMTRANRGNQWQALEWRVLAAVRGFRKYNVSDVESLVVKFSLLVFESGTGLSGGLSLSLSLSLSACVTCHIFYQLAWGTKSGYVYRSVPSVSSSSLFFPSAPLYPPPPPRPSPVSLSLSLVLMWWCFEYRCILVSVT